MGWRVQQQYEKAGREQEKVWFAQLPLGMRARIRAFQSFKILLLALVLVSVGMCIARATPVDHSAVEVVDGDTIRIGSHIFRLVGFNTPEPGLQARCEKERSLAARASFRLRQLIANGGLELSRVPCACPTGTEGTQRCNYGRLCAILTAGGREVGAILISEGLAKEYICVGARCPRRTDWCQETP